MVKLHHHAATRVPTGDDVGLQSISFWLNALLIDELEILHSSHTKSAADLLVAASIAAAFTAGQATRVNNNQLVARAAA